MYRYRLDYTRDGVRGAVIFTSEEKLYASYCYQGSYSNEAQVYLLNGGGKLRTLSRMTYEEGMSTPWSYWVPRESFIGFQQIPEQTEGDEIR